MIQDFDKLNKLSSLSNFQSLILDRLKNLFEKIDISKLNEISHIENTDECITLSLVHKDDVDSIITVNIHREYISLWISECDMYFDKDHDIERFKNIFSEALSGKYESSNFYFKNKMIFSSTTFQNLAEEKCIVPHTSFYRFYNLFYKDRFIQKKQSYESFF